MFYKSIIGVTDLTLYRQSSMKVFLNYWSLTEVQKILIMYHMPGCNCLLVGHVTFLTFWLIYVTKRAIKYKVGRF